MELRHAGENSTTSAYRVCGFHPYNPNPDAWRQVLCTLGKQNDELKKEKDDGKKEEELEYEVKIKSTVDQASLTQNEKEKLLEGMSESTTPTDAAYFHLRSLLARWREIGHPGGTIPPFLSCNSYDEESVSTLGSSPSTACTTTTANPSTTCTTTNSKPNKNPSTTCAATTTEPNKNPSTTCATTRTIEPNQNPSKTACAKTLTLATTDPLSFPVTETERISLRLFDFVSRKEQYGELVKEHGKWSKKVKNRDEQYIEQTARILGCCEITSSVQLTYVEHDSESGLQREVRGSATRMRSGWFSVTLEDDRQLKIKEADLYNKNRYILKQAKVTMTSEQRDKINRKAKRKSKKTEMELTRIRKEEANEARKHMLEEEMDKILVYAEEGFLDKKCLKKLVEKATSPFTHVTDDYKTVVDAKEATCASILSLSAVNTVLGDKRKADELSRIEAAKRQEKSKKRRTPNTTRGESGVAVIMKLHDHDRRQEETDNKKKREDITKEIEAGNAALTDWEKLLSKRQREADSKMLNIAAPELWQLFVEGGGFTKAERQCILKISVPNSGVLSKNEKEHVNTFRVNNVTYSKITSDVIELRNKLTKYQKEIQDSNSLSDNLPASFDRGSNEDKEQFSDIDEDMIDLLCE